MSDVIKCCPFCGGEAIFQNFVIEAHVYCDTCKAKLARMHGPNSDDGIVNVLTAWNRRAQPDGLADLSDDEWFELHVAIKEAYKYGAGGSVEKIVANAARQYLAGRDGGGCE